jgi:hypothetical protein
MRENMRKKIPWMAAALSVLLCAVLLVPACSQDEGTLPTGSSSLTSSSELESMGALAQKDSESEDSVSEDSESEDSVSEDSESEDSESEDSDSNGGEEAAEGPDDDGDRVDGLLSDFGSCPSSLTLDGTDVITTSEGTRFDCEPGCLIGGVVLEERLDADQFCQFLTLGLPVRVRGAVNGGGFDASRVRIDDEIKATGTISASSDELRSGAVTAFTLSVIGVGDLPFVVGAGAEIDDFPAGDVVRVEGDVVPPLTIGGTPMYTATEIESD